MKKIIAFITLLFGIFILTSCNNKTNDNSDIETKPLILTYKLVENNVNGENVPIPNGEYLYLTFKENGIVENKQKKPNEEEIILTANYTKGEDCYIVSMPVSDSGITLSITYQIQDNGEKLVSIQNLGFTIKQTFQLVK